MSVFGLGIAKGFADEVQRDQEAAEAKKQKMFELAAQNFQTDKKIHAAQLASGIKTYQAQKSSKAAMIERATLIQKQFPGATSAQVIEVTNATASEKDSAKALKAANEYFVGITDNNPDRLNALRMGTVSDEAGRIMGVSIPEPTQPNIPTPTMSFMTDKRSNFSRVMDPSGLPTEQEAGAFQTAMGITTPVTPSYTPQPKAPEQKIVDASRPVTPRVEVAATTTAAKKFGAPRPEIKAAIAASGFNFENKATSDLGAKVGNLNQQGAGSDIQNNNSRVASGVYSVTGDRQEATRVTNNLYQPINDTTVFATPMQLVGAGGTGVGHEIGDRNYKTEVAARRRNSGFRTEAEIKTEVAGITDPTEKRTRMVQMIEDRNAHLETLYRSVNEAVNLADNPVSRKAMTLEGPNALAEWADHMLFKGYLPQADVVTAVRTTITNKANQYIEDVPTVDKVVVFQKKVTELTKALGGGKIARAIIGVEEVSTEPQSTVPKVEPKVTPVTGPLPTEIQATVSEEAKRLEQTKVVPEPVAPAQAQQDYVSLEPDNIFIDPNVQNILVMAEEAMSGIGPARDGLQRILETATPEFKAKVSKAQEDVAMLEATVTGGDNSATASKYKNFDKIPSRIQTALTALDLVQGVGDLTSSHFFTDLVNKKKYLEAAGSLVENTPVEAKDNKLYTTALRILGTG